MSSTDWLRRQVQFLENEIRTSRVFDDDSPATPEEIRHIRETVVIHTFLKQQLLRRERVPGRNTQEFLLVPTPSALES